MVGSEPFSGDVFWASDDDDEDDIVSSLNCQRPYDLCRSVTPLFVCLITDEVPLFKLLLP